MLDSAAHALQVPAELVVLPILDTARPSADIVCFSMLRLPCSVTLPGWRLDSSRSGLLESRKRVARLP